MIEMTPIAHSSAVEAMGYDPASQTLAVRYKNAKSTAHYRGVEPHVFEQAQAADSVGGFLNSTLRPGVAAGDYEHEAIPDEDEAES